MLKRIAALLCGIMSTVAVVNAHTANIGNVAFEVNAFPGQTLRLRVRFHPDAYEVSDVVVGAEDTTPVVGDCSSSEGCKFHHPSGSVLHVSSVPNEENGIQRFEVRYSVGSSLVTTAVIRMDGQQPKAEFSFPQARRLYGIPEHAVDLALKSGVTYRLMNLDVFRYKLDDAGGIYGTIPYLMALGRERAAGVLFLNSADSSVAVSEDSAANAWRADWRCESGIHDIFFFSAPTPMELHAHHAHVVGPTQLPPLFALGYHQCRWNYRSIADSLEVDDGFDTHNIPYDVLWLDIEHTDGKRYFTWDPHTFGQPDTLTRALDAKGRKLVTISDPHIKRDDNYHVHREARDQSYYVKTESGADFEGHCWPGQSSWIDFYNANARKWYATLYLYDRYPGSAPNVFTWIDMNEPSVFNAHEVTMDKNAVHHTADGKAVRHRDLHNMYGYYHTIAAYDGHILRSSGPPHDKVARPFILTRSFFSGSQRYAAMWTGDNAADWAHLRKSIPMLLTLSLSNYAFVGADVGGFFDNPSAELLVRWYQTAAFTPFFRGHAHLETKRREPWLFGDTVTTVIRNAIALRYALLPYIYTTFLESHDEGSTVMRPLIYHWPGDDRWLEEQVAFMCGPSLLVRPIVDEGATSVAVPLPSSESWFEFPSGAPVKPGSNSHTLHPITMDTIPLYVRGGRIVPVRERLRRNTQAMSMDPITLFVAASSATERRVATGRLYIDDGYSFDYQSGAYAFTEFVLDANALIARPISTRRVERNPLLFRSPVLIEKIVFFGFETIPKNATASTASSDVVEANGAAAVLARSLHIVTGSHGAFVLRRPELPVDGSWRIDLTF